MTRRDSFLHIKNWLDDVTTHGHEEIKVALIANKADMLSQRQGGAGSWEKDGGRKGVNGLHLTPSILKQSFIRGGPGIC